MIRANGGKAPRRLQAAAGRGFESFQFHWWADIGTENPVRTAGSCREILGTAEIPFSFALYGNPLRQDAEGSAAVLSIRRLIGLSAKLGSPFVGLFTGRLPGTPWEASLPAFTGLFEELCREAADHGVGLAMENCPMDGSEDSGDWNLAHHPEHWARLYSALSSGAGDALYLEWEPAHQILQGRDPMGDINDWADRIIHVHGKDAEAGNGAVIQTLPGNGSTDWRLILSQLENTGYSGTIDIEGYHDREWSGDREIDGQVKALEYLKACRDGRWSGSDWPG